MAELTLEQKKALALASARRRAAEAAGENIALDIMEPERLGTRDSMLGKVDAFVRGVADTVSFGFADELAAGANTLFGDQDYEKNLARERATDRADAEERAMQRLTGQLTGGVLQGAGLLKAGLSPTAKAIEAGKSLPKVMTVGALEGGTLGALQGLGSGEDTEDRVEKATLGAGLGFALGGTIPAVVSGGKEIFDRATSFMAPEAAKKRVMAAMLRNADLTPEDVVARLQAAQDDGQTMFTVADAVELPAQRHLSTVARSPNEARKKVVDAMIGRQTDQGRRIASNLEDASGSVLTADQYKQLLTQRRSEDAARNYAPVMDDTSAINVSHPVRLANRAISPVAEKLAQNRGDLPTDLASRAPIEDAERSIRDPIREAVREARSYLAADNLTVTNVEKAFRAKTNIDQMIAKATENGQGGQVAALEPIRDALDYALAATSKDYAAARDAYRLASERVDAVDVGRELSRGRKRVDDVLSTFGALPDDEARQAARVGYFDRKIADAESTKGLTTNAARPFLSESMRRELPALAYPGRADQLMRRLERENIMSATREHAISGSRTLDNMMDSADSGFDPGVVASIIQGRWLDAAKSAATQAANYTKGLPPSVLARTGPMLLETDPQIAHDMLTASAQQMSLSDQARARVVAALLANGGMVPRLVSP
ncbi:MAG: hypothetical protein H6881_09700 [Rhodobiaceae bacterium]|nr:hypothetical protein [Rhodobiaceae bacterium]